MKLSKFVLIVSALVFVTSCASNDFISLKIEERSLPFPPGYYNHLVYLDGKIIGFADDSNAPKEKQISFAYEGDSERHSGGHSTDVEGFGGCAQRRDIDRLSQDGLSPGSF